MKNKAFNSSKWLTRYGLALFISAWAFVLTRWTLPVIKDNAFDFFLGAVVIIACLDGLGPALFSAALAIPVLDFFFMPPINAFSVSTTDFLRLLVFGAVATLAGSLSARLKQAKSDLQKARDELETRVALRTKELTLANTHLADEMAQRHTTEKEILQISQREQRRLSEDLHDGLCQTLVGIRLLAQDVRDAALADNLPWAAEMEKINARLGDALGQADVVARGLYPVELETNGLAGALKELAAKLSAIYRVRCHFLAQGEALASIDSATANHLYRIAQEAVMNAIKRGKSKRISLRLRQRQTRVLLSITDDGIGLRNQTPRNGMGFKMMQYRARMIHAAFHVRSRPNGFTRVLCAFQPANPKELSYENGPPEREN